MKYFFAGDNQFMLEKRVRQLTDEFISRNGDLALERIDSEESSLASIIDAVKSLPFLSSEKLVIIHNISDKELIEKLIELEVPDTNTIIVVISKLDKRATYYKKITKLQNFKIFEKPNSMDMPRWVVEYVDNQKGKINILDARYLIDRIGTNQILLCNELDKLINFNANITQSSINELTDPLPQSSVFNLLDAAFTGNLKDTERLYKEQRAQKVEPLAILGMIAWQLHILAIVKSAGGKSADIIAKEAKLNPFVVRKAQKLASKLSFNDVRSLVNDACELDVLLKTKNIDTDQSILLYLSQIKG